MDNHYRALRRLINRYSRAVAFSPEGYAAFVDQSLALQMALQAAEDPRGPHMAPVILRALEAYTALPKATGTEEAPCDALYTMPRSLLAKYLQPACIVNNVLRRGEVAILSGAPKGKKTWMGYDLALACLHGGYWLGEFHCQQCNVLYVDMECHEGTIRYRLETLYNHHRWSGMQPVADEALQIAALRTSGTGKNVPNTVERLINTIWDSGAELVIIDTVSAFLPLEDENANAEVNQAMGQIMAAATQTECAILLIHHTPKNAQNREVTDTAAGAGAFTRRPDTVLSVTTETVPPPAEQGGDATTNYYLDFRFRSHPPLDRHRIDWLDVGGTKPMHVVPSAKHDPKVYEAKKRKAPA